MHVPVSSILIAVLGICLAVLSRRAEAYVVGGHVRRRHDLSGPRRLAGAGSHEPGRRGARQRLFMPRLDTPPAISHGLLLTARSAAGAGQADESAGTNAEISGGVRTSTCRVCHQCFVPDSNNDRACRYHPGDFLGAENSKFYGVRSGGKLTGLSLFYDCCGADSYDAPGCTYARHLTYDDE